MAAVRCALAIALTVITSVPAHAQVVCRKNVPPGDATPDGGSFSIHFPVAFNNVEVSAQDPGASAPATLLMLIGADSDHIRFSATEVSMAGFQPKPMESKDGEEILSVALTVADGGYYFRVIRADKIQYMQVVQFPESGRAKATKMKDDFFDSFRLVANAPAGQ